MSACCHDRYERRALRQEAKAERREDRLRTRATAQLCRGNVGKAMVLHAKADHAHDMAMAAGMRADAHHYAHVEYPCYPRTYPQCNPPQCYPPQCYPPQCHETTSVVQEIYYVTPPPPAIHYPTGTAVPPPTMHYPTGTVEPPPPYY